MKKINYIILVIGLLTLTFIGTLFLTRNYINMETLKIEKPSYEYLKSITVYIVGKTIPEEKESELIEVKESWAGTGAIIKIDKEYTYILTNKHVIGHNKKAIIFVENDLKMVEAELVALHDSDIIDLAVIKIKGKLKGKREIKGISTASYQDRLYLVGHHLGRKYIYGEGVFAGYDGIYDIIQIPTLYGNSGTAVCNSKGELIAMIFAINKIGLFNIDVAHGITIDGLNVELFLIRLGLL